MQTFRSFLLRRSFTFGVLFGAFATLGSGAPIAYVQTDQQQFGIVDLGTGAYSHRGNTAEVLVGLGIQNGTIYGVDALDRLVTIDPQTAATTVIGPTGIPGADPNGNVGAVPVFTSLTTGGLFGFDWSNNLYSINSATGMASFVGATGIPARTGPFGSVAAAGDSTALYYIIEEITDPVTRTVVIPGSVYRIDPATGEAVLLPQGIPELPFPGAGFADGSLYLFRATLGGLLPPAEIWRVDPSSGALISVINQDPALGDVFGAVQAPIPEPGTLWLLAGGLVAFTIRCRSRR
jgi:hypothetical protein